MVGLNVAYANSRGISIPINSIKATANTLMNEGKIRVAHLGISTDVITLPERLATQPTIDQEEGLMIVEVEPNSPANKAGLVVGDILITLAKSKITNHYELRRLLTKEAIGKSIDIGLLRAEKLVKLTIIPTEDASH